jgi:hypothetical protein
MTLAQRQAELVAALVTGAEPPPGFDRPRLLAARAALLRKRAGEVAQTWPLLAASFGPQWSAEFARWAADRAPVGPLRDGWDLARDLRTSSELATAAAEELSHRESRWRYDGLGPPRRRWLRLTQRHGRWSLPAQGRHRR